MPLEDNTPEAIAATITITHSRAEGTLVEGTERGDGTAEILKQYRFRWSRNLGQWYLPRSRDNRANTYTIKAATNALHAAGFTVAVELDNTARDTAEAEAEKEQRAEARAAALADKAARKATAAHAADRAAAATLDRLPDNGQPILVGHYSERGHRKAIERSWNAMGKSVAAQNEAEEAERRAAVAAQAHTRRYSWQQINNRMGKLQADLNRLNRAVNGHSRNHRNGRGETIYTDVIPPATGKYRDNLTEEIQQTENDLSFWQEQRRKHLEETGRKEYNRDNVATGDVIKWRGDLYEVKRVNAKSVSVVGVKVFNEQTGYRLTGTVKYSEICQHIDAETWTKAQAKNVTEQTETDSEENASADGSTIAATAADGSAVIIAEITRSTL